MPSSPSWVSTVIQSLIVSRIDMSNIDFVGVDPFAAVSPDDNIASLRIFIQYDPTDWIVIQDNREYSVLSVLSTLGGMWTGFNGIFALIFGAGMWVVLGKSMTVVRLWAGPFSFQHDDPPKIAT
jgi:hypothetical protein